MVYKYPKMLLAGLIGATILFSASAQSSITIDDVTYDLNEDGTASVSSYTGTDKEDVVIPQTVSDNGAEYTVTEIGYRSFSYNESFKNLTLPSTITTIGDYAFTACKGMETINLQDTQVTAIGNSTFGACWALKNLTLPATCVSVYATQNPFYMPKALEWFAVAEDNPALKAIDGVLYTKSGKTLLAYPLAKGDTYSVPEGTDTIANSAFMNGQNIKSITLPEGLTHIGMSAFVYCDQMTTINIPSTVKKILGSAFDYCTSLTSDIILPEGLTDLGAAAFRYCKMQKVVIPSTCTWINKNTFYGCTNMFYLTLSEGIETLGESCFSYCAILEAVIPNSVTRVDSYVFSGDTNIKKVVVGTGLADFYFLTPFRDCTSIEEVISLRETPPEYLEAYNRNYPLFPSNVYSDATLIVPENSEDAYRSAVGWKNFYTITPTGVRTVADDSNISISAKDGNIVVLGASAVDIYTVSGQHVYSGKEGIVSLPSGAVYIVRADDKVSKVAL